MSEDLYQNTEKNEKEDSGKRRRRNKKIEKRIIGISVLGLLLVACGAPSGNTEGNPDGWEDSDPGNGSDVGKKPQNAETKEEWKKRRFDTKEHPLTVWSADKGKRFWSMWISSSLAKTICRK